jgi:peptidoglycan-N-acetylglucosamine deacetylase
MPKLSFDIVIRKYEVIIIAVFLILTGSIAVLSRDAELKNRPFGYYPFKIALTFDDGPHPAFTEKIITVLDKKDVPATFFVVGMLALRYPYLVNLISSGGNEVAGHTFSHRNLSTLSRQEIRRELVITDRLIKDITGKKSNYFRPPGGRYNQDVLDMAKDNGLKMILWSVFPKDHEENNAKVIVERVLAQAKDNGVIILHSGKTATLEALPEIIDTLKKRGFEFVTLEYLEGSRDPNTLTWLK